LIIQADELVIRASEHGDPVKAAWPLIAIRFIFSCTRAKRWCDVRDSVAIRGKADVMQTSDFSRD